MDTTKENLIKEPVGRIMGKINKMSLGNIQQNLSYLDIERSFYPLLLIEFGKGKLTQQELAEKLFCDKVQVVRIVDYLSLNGYVERTQSPIDRRKYELNITDKASKVIPDIRNVIQKTSEVALRGLSQEQIDELYAMLRLIETNLLSLKK
ncbi:MarR family winged helix-turn-helix transcriptional regulator [uncultured Bacteroides sp.]|uniref:MarR family winged helix-turn-helix transcriptional regulator n=1 Tax=uncultured Bacteroides sp. TaxID=162156 RepID=UPI002AA771BD|nr:MarR family winged helix-turn-helix transcriptional regulator [uncultured Bacteroides sp.]